MKTLLFILTVTCLSLNHSSAQSANAEQLMDGFKTGKYEISDYNTACYFALAGNTPAALVYLKAAINAGFSDTKTLMQDSDLASLHTEASWNSLVQQTKTRNAG
ncbi:TPR end-of-group domain-containing protein [Parafilimonas sp.]|uniref:TPR end-of-group domain-containing protein n=1 Tax=Parafilimonas sp. TaxID=1969739 RepID=UPI0039E6D70B